MPAKKKYTETELVSLLQNGDKSAFSYLYDNYSRSLIGVINAVVNDEHTAEDLLQLTFVRIWKNFASYNASKGRLFTWMLNIARNIAIDHTRSRMNKDGNMNRDIDKSIFEVNRLYHETIPQDDIGLKRAVANLKSEHREIIHLAYYEGYTQEEISGKMEIPLGTVKTRVRQAILQLRTVIKPEIDR